MFGLRVGGGIYDASISRISWSSSSGDPRWNSSGLKGFQGRQQRRRQRVCEASFIIKFNFGVLAKFLYDKWQRRWFSPQSSLHRSRWWSAGRWSRRRNSWPNWRRWRVWWSRRSGRRQWWRRADRRWRKWRWSRPSWLSRGFDADGKEAELFDLGQKVYWLSVTHCTACGALGHWHEDPECPMNAGNGKGREKTVHQQPKTSPNYHEDP